METTHPFPFTNHQLHDDEMIVDLFAGGGGASQGIYEATGRHPDVAINHDPAAIRMHEANHPETRHYCESIYDVDPLAACGGKPVGLLWASPSCTHFSRARGAVPVSRQERGLGWMVRKWAGKVRPRVILCENVEEWQTWGPVRRGRPVKSRAGAYFRKLVWSLVAMGYAVEWRMLNAADYGAATSRRRLFLVARRDGEPIVWPKATHLPGQYRPASEVIDWQDLGISIFDRPKPLVDATCRRIAAGVARYVLKGRPFIAPVTTATVDYACLVAGFLAKHFTGVVGQPLTKPCSTITAVDHHALVTVDLAKMPEAAKDSRAPVVAAFIALYYGQGGQHTCASEPLGTIVTKARHALVTVVIDGETFVLRDIRMRMLRPRELAAAQGFPGHYRLEGTIGEQIGRIGNSVAPPAAAALVAANVNRPGPLRIAG